MWLFLAARRRSSRWKSANTVHFVIFVLQLQRQFHVRTIATGPVGLEPNGRTACRYLSPTSSECFIQCDDEYVLANVLIFFLVHLVQSYHRYTLVEGNKCVFDDGNGVKDCECDAPLSFAYPDQACACVTSLEEGSPGTQCGQWFTQEHSNSNFKALLEC